MSASMTRTKTSEGGHSGPPKSGLEKPAAVGDGVQTELGRLPADWSALPIRDVGEVITGRTPSTKREDLYNGEYNLISPADLDNGKYVVTAHKRLSEVGFKECRALPKDSVLVGCIGNVGKLGMISDERSATNQQINAVICDKNHDSHFIYYCLHENRARLEWAADKTTLPILNKTNFENFEIATPPLPEQRKIAAMLGLVQRAIEQQERLIVLTTELKKALLHKLFSEGLRGEPQKQTEIGPVPESWEATTLGVLASKPSGFLQTGPFGSQLHKHDYLKDGIGVVNPTHLWDNQINHEEVPRVSPETAARLERHRLAVGDILFARRGEIGRHGMVTEKEEGWLCGTGCFLARVRRKDIDNRFLSYLFSTSGCIAWLNSHAAGAIMPNLNNTVLKSMPVFFPKLETQADIADCLDAAEKKMAIHERKKQSLTNLFRTLLHQLMTAQIRVHDLDLGEILQQPVAENLSQAVRENVDELSTNGRQAG